MVKTRAAQEDKNDTQQNNFNKIGRLYWPTITSSTRISVKRLNIEISQLLRKTTNFAPALQSPQIPRPSTKAVPLLGTSAAATAPSQRVLRRRRCRLPDQMPSFHRFKLRQGAKWTIGRTTPFFGSCNNSPCRHRHRARTNQPTYSSPGRSRRPASESPVPGLALVCVRRTGPTLTQSRQLIYVEV